MDALSLVVNSKLVGDDVRHTTGGYAEVRRTADEALRAQRRRHPQWSTLRHPLWSTLRRSVTARLGLSSASTKKVVNNPSLVAQSSRD